MLIRSGHVLPRCQILSRGVCRNNWLLTEHVIYQSVARITHSDKLVIPKGWNSEQKKVSLAHQIDSSMLKITAGTRHNISLQYCKHVWKVLTSR